MLNTSSFSYYSLSQDADKRLSKMFKAHGKRYKLNLLPATFSRVYSRFTIFDWFIYWKKFIRGLSALVYESISLLWSFLSRDLWENFHYLQIRGFQLSFYGIEISKIRVKFWRFTVTINLNNVSFERCRDYRRFKTEPFSYKYIRKKGTEYHNH